MSISDSGVQLPARPRPPRMINSRGYGQQIPKKQIIKNLFSQPPAIESQQTRRRPGLQDKVSSAFRSLGARPEQSPINDSSVQPNPTIQPIPSGQQSQQPFIDRSSRLANYNQDLQQQVEEARAELQRRQNERIEQIQQVRRVAEQNPLQEPVDDMQSFEPRSPVAQPPIGEMSPFNETDSPPQFIDRPRSLQSIAQDRVRASVEKFSTGGRLPKTKPVSVLNKPRDYANKFQDTPSTDEFPDEFQAVDGTGPSETSDSSELTIQVPQDDQLQFRDNALRSPESNDRQDPESLDDPMQDDLTDNTVDEQDDFGQEKEQIRVQEEDSRLKQKTCDEFRKQLLNNPITDIALDISPPGPTSSLGSSGLSRKWMDQYGSVLASGSMVDMRRGYVIIDSGGGRIKIPYARLSDSDLAAISEYWSIPTECGVGWGMYAGRAWAPQTFTWTASSLCHKPLYFENIQLERYGHSAGPFLQPIDSTFHFFTSLFFLPYNTAINPPNECQYALGYYRPGDCAPWLKSPVPISLRGATRQALFWTGFAGVTH